MRQASRHLPSSHCQRRRTEKVASEWAGRTPKAKVPGTSAAGRSSCPRHEALVRALARLYQAKRQHQEAVAFYEKAIPELDRLRVTEADPVGFAGYLEEYAQELSLAGRGESACAGGWLAGCIAWQASAIRSREVHGALPESEVS